MAWENEIQVEVAFEVVGHTILAVGVTALGVALVKPACLE